MIDIREHGGIYGGKKNDAIEVGMSEESKKLIEEGLLPYEKIRDGIVFSRGDYKKGQEVIEIDAFYTLGEFDEKEVGSGKSATALDMKKNELLVGIPAIKDRKIICYEMKRQEGLKGEVTPFIFKEKWRTDSPYGNYDFSFCTEDGLLISPGESFGKFVYRREGEGYVPTDIGGSSKYFHDFDDIVIKGKKYRVIFEARNIGNYFIFENSGGGDYKFVKSESTSLPSGTSNIYVMKYDEKEKCFHGLKEDNQFKITLSDNLELTSEKVDLGFKKDNFLVVDRKNRKYTSSGNGRYGGKDVFSDLGENPEYVEDTYQVRSGKGHIRGLNDFDKESGGPKKVLTFYDYEGVKISVVSDGFHSIPGSGGTRSIDRGDFYKHLDFYKGHPIVRMNSSRIGLEDGKRIAYKGSNDVHVSSQGEILASRINLDSSGSQKDKGFRKFAVLDERDGTIRRDVGYDLRLADYRTVNETLGTRLDLSFASHTKFLEEVRLTDTQTTNTFSQTAPYKVQVITIDRVAYITLVVPVIVDIDWLNVEKYPISYFFSPRSNRVTLLEDVKSRSFQDAKRLSREEL